MTEVNPQDVLACIDRFGPLTFRQVSDRFGTEDKEMRHIIHTLVKKMKLENIGNGGCALYEIPNKARNINTVPPRTISVMDGYLDPNILQMNAVRDGADDHRLHPSRIGGTLRYMDGRTEKV